jgi:RNA polymerase sigma-70 factor (ECF subfamily)
VNPESRAAFDALVLVHLDAAWRFARWMVGDESAAEDALQEACTSAWRAFDSRSGDNARGWFMAIVRNACTDELRHRQRRSTDEAYDDEMHGGAAGPESVESIVERASEARWIRREIARLPDDFREVVVLRDLEGLSYREIGQIVGVPAGTVMSRLSRARDALAVRARARLMKEQA